MNVAARNIGRRSAKSLAKMPPAKAAYLVAEAQYQLAAEAYRAAVKALGPEPEWPAEGEDPEMDAACLARCEREEQLATEHGYHTTRRLRDAAAREVIRVSLAATAKAHPAQAADLEYLAAKVDKSIPGLADFDRVLDVCMRGPF